MNAEETLQLALLDSKKSALSVKAAKYFATHDCSLEACIAAVDVMCNKIIVLGPTSDELKPVLEAYPAALTKIYLRFSRVLDRQNALSEELRQQLIGMKKEILFGLCYLWQWTIASSSEASKSISTCTSTSIRGNKTFLISLVKEWLANEQPFAVKILQRSRLSLHLFSETEIFQLVDLWYSFTRVGRQDLGPILKNVFLDQSHNLRGVAAHAPLLVGITATTTGMSGFFAVSRRFIKFLEREYPDRPEKVQNMREALVVTYSNAVASFNKRAKVVDLGDGVLSQGLPKKPGRTYRTGQARAFA